MSRTMSRLQKSEMPGFQLHLVSTQAPKLRSHRGASIALSLLILLVPSLLVAGGLLYQEQTSKEQGSVVALTESVSVVAAVTPESIPAQEAPELDPDELVVSDVDSELFSIRPAPQVGELKALPRQMNYASVNAETVNSDEQETQVSNEQDDSVLAQVDSEDEPQQLADESNNPQVKQNTSSAGNEAMEGDLLQGLDLTELSPELALKIESILDNSDSPSEVDIDQYRPQPTVQLESHTQSLSGRLPSLNLQTHMYSSSAERRWVKINDKEVAQGDWITPEVQLIEVKPQSIVVEFEEQAIEIPALYEWQG
ncbi:general secretion pathway protein GspB [Vibrio sp. D420a]|uniref:general secretion pathway protein GspB n=1 Tax=Vibrio sp. D420a TaxID=2836895 RepID=UPI002554FFB3|nr:general secretion pathway protein GspB [Vibrio sp. D420a]MDK9764134.1 general secretion pathway protein GspB [Vibrio sp. D420a]